MYVCVKLTLTFIRHNPPLKKHTFKIFCFTTTQWSPQTSRHACAYTCIHTHTTCMRVKVCARASHPIFFIFKEQKNRLTFPSVLGPRQLEPTPSFRACAWSWHQFLHSVWRRINAAGAMRGIPLEMTADAAAALRTSALQTAEGSRSSRTRLARCKWRWRVGGKPHVGADGARLGSPPQMLFCLFFH